jgi:ubiquinone/menaquinone biosynthesis C-methylase UbiE
MVAARDPSPAGFAATYARQAQTYDRTRSAGSETLEPLMVPLAAAPGRFVLDVGGGTGNYAAAMTEAGYEVLVLDMSPDMLNVAASKGLNVRRADAISLPEPDSCADAVTMIAMLHQIPDWKAALREARRVLRPGGILCLLLYTSEHMASHFFLDYFPSSRAWATTDMRPISEYMRELPGAVAMPLQIRGTEDLTMQAMRRHPALALDPELTAQTSFFTRLHSENPQELAAGLERLAEDIESGRLPDAYDQDITDGDAYLVTWQKPEHA